MRRRHLVIKSIRKRKIYFSILLGCLTIIGIGFAVFNTDLDILGLLGISNYRVPINTAWDYDYKEEIQTFKIPQDGIYRLEAWGAQGADSVGVGGAGGYSYGTGYFTKGQILYIVTGGAGTQAEDNSTPVAGGYNGGGNSVYTGGSGGGATHIATSTGLLTEFAEKQNDMLLVAGGGGGSGTYTEDTTIGGCGGGSTGCDGGDLSETYTGGGHGGSQIAGGTIGTGTVAGEVGVFGHGGYGGYNESALTGSGGGGGGWYGGAGGSGRCGGGGGSGYANRNVLMTAELVAGSLSFGSPTGEAEKGHTGSGYVRITLLESYTVTVSSNDTSKGTVSPSSKHVKVNDDVLFTLSAENGYAYASDTCGGSIEGNNLIIENVTNDITCTVTFNPVYLFDYTGSEQTFTVPEDGIYRLETWGAQGGRNIHEGSLAATGGYGGYSAGEIYLSKDEVLYINVGGKGANGAVNVLTTVGGYNGGGNGRWDNHDDEASGAGGGATHIATVSGLLSSLSDSRDSILIVSGGGGGSSYQNNGGDGGGFEGTINMNVIVSGTKAGTQTTGYQFGKGGVGVNTTSTPGGGGGGGWYGGYGGAKRTSGGNSDVPGAGGSGYIGNSSLNNKHMSCHNCTTSDEVSTKTISNTNTSSVALADYSKEGNGYVRITYITNETHTVNAISANENKATITPNSRKVRTNSNAEFVVNLNTGYGYISDTCGGFMQGNILVIPNVKTDKNCVVDFGELSVFDYTGGEQTFVAPKTGMYKLKVWGAQGGNTDVVYRGGYGGYATGNVFLEKDEQLYINVGGQGACAAEEETAAGGYNGGGGALTAGGGTGKVQCSGGGATHVAKATGLLMAFESNQDNLLIVAGGGGGAGYQTGMYDNPNGTNGGNGGGMEGALVRNECTDCGTLIPATQTHAGTGRFGSGSFGLGSGTIEETSSGGGGGYYGGGSDTYEWGGSGGSGYIGNTTLANKYMACYDCVESTEESTYTKSNRRVFTLAVEDASKAGNGHAEILYIEVEDYFTLSYNDNGGEGCSDKPTRTKSYREWGELCTPTREDYAFKEWNTAQDGTGTTITSQTESLADQTVYAIWLPYHTLTYNTMGGSACDPTFARSPEEREWGTLCRPGKLGYTFEGWNTAQDGTGTTITSKTIVTTDLTVYAQYLEVTTTDWSYSYTGEPQSFTAPYSGEYRIELWGGHGASSHGGKGAYVYGNLYLDKDETLYVYVGGGGSNRWNGGGSGSSGHTGGGATDVRLVEENKYSRIMVAGGGGGPGGTYISGGHGGLLYGGSGERASKKNGCETLSPAAGTGGSQVSGASFGSGKSAATSSPAGGAGGGGYWGGTQGIGTDKTNDCGYLSAASGGGGGSSYISGALGYVAVAEDGVTTPRNDSNGDKCTATSATTDITCSVHYSGKTFTYTGGEANNRSGNGAAIITFLSTFTITYDNNGGEGCTELIQDHDVAWGPLCVPTREGYTFAEWNTKADGTGSSILSTQIARSNVQAYAIWQDAGPEWNYSSTGVRKAFRAPTTGTYKVELWGAQGATGNGGKGAYIYGNIALNEGDTFYVYVGGRNRWNGGGGGASDHYGGGATDIRLVEENRYSRIMVAGGGGGPGGTYINGGIGGAVNGGNGERQSKQNGCETLAPAAGTGGKQTTGASFGVGKSAATTSPAAGGGGGGYWGGTEGIGTDRTNDCGYLSAASGGGGGSSYISGVLGYVAVSENGSTKARNDSNGVKCTETAAASDVTCSIHYSGKVFTSTGADSGEHTGEGAAKITLLN